MGGVTLKKSNFDAKMKGVNSVSGDAPMGLLFF